MGYNRLEQCTAPPPPHPPAPNFTIPRPLVLSQAPSDAPTENISTRHLEAAAVVVCAVVGLEEVSSEIHPRRCVIRHLSYTMYAYHVF